MANLITRFFVEAGYPASSIRVNRGVDLPGYFRPSKQWDVVVGINGVLVAAFELQALGGPSFGNNANNRIEEALGSSMCLRRAALSDLYPGEPPWLGYLFVMEDAPASRRPVRVPVGALRTDSIWDGESYQGRFGITLRRILNLLTCGWLETAKQLVDGQHPVKLLSALAEGDAEAAVRVAPFQGSGCGYRTTGAAF